MPDVRESVEHGIGGGFAFDCPSCGVRLLVGLGERAVAGTCPACGGWIQAPVASGGPASVVPGCAMRAGMVRKRGGSARMVSAGVRGVSPDVIRDLSHEHRQDMRGFCRFLLACGVVLSACLLLIWWVLRS